MKIKQWILNKFFKDEIKSAETKGVWDYISGHSKRLAEDKRQQLLPMVGEIVISISNENQQVIVGRLVNIDSFSENDPEVIPSIISFGPQNKGELFLCMGKVILFTPAIFDALMKLSAKERCSSLFTNCSSDHFNDWKTEDTGGLSNEEFSDYIYSHLYSNETNLTWSIK